MASASTVASATHASTPTLLVQCSSGRKSARPAASPVRKAPGSRWPRQASVRAATDTGANGHAPYGGKDNTSSAPLPVATAMRRPRPPRVEGWAGSPGRAAASSGVSGGHPRTSGGTVNGAAASWPASWSTGLDGTWPALAVLPPRPVPDVGDQEGNPSDLRTDSPPAGGGHACRCLLGARDPSARSTAAFRRRLPPGTTRRAGPGPRSTLPSRLPGYVRQSLGQPAVG